MRTKMEYTEIFVEGRTDKKRFYRVTVYEPENIFHFPFLIATRYGLFGDSESPTDWEIMQSDKASAVIRYAIAKLDSYKFPALKEKVK